MRMRAAARTATEAIRFGGRSCRRSGLFASGLFFVTIFCAHLSPVRSWALSESPELLTPAVRSKLTAQNHRVLSGRFHEILDFRLSGLAKCDAGTRVDLEARFARLEPSSRNQEVAIATLQLYADSHKVEPICRAALDRAERRFHRIERRLFAPLSGLVSVLCSSEARAGSRDIECESRIVQVLADLDPNCIRVQVDNPSGQYDAFPCMAGDYMIGRDLLEGSAAREMITEVRTLLQRIHRLSHIPEGSEDGEARPRSIDLYALYRDSRVDTSGRRQRFLAIWTMLNASTHSMSSYLQGYHHQIARATLFASGSAEEAVIAYVESRLLTDEFRALRASKGLQFTIGAVVTTGMNRHDFMAAYLACRYREENRSIHQRLPKLLGVAYESMDLISHLKDGDTLKDAWRALKVDTRRYRRGVRWGFDFCSTAP